MIVGNFTVDSIRPLVLTWLGGLPSTHRKETWKDIGVHTPTGVVTRDVKRGTEPKARTVIVFNGPFEWTRENRYAMASLAEVLRMRFRDVLREQLGGTYDVSVSQSSERDPRHEYQFSVDFGSAPERVDTLRAAVFREIERIKRDGPTAEEIEKVREIQRRGEETEVRQNGFWLNALASAARYGQDPRMILKRSELRATLTPDAACATLRGSISTSRVMCRSDSYPSREAGVEYRQRPIVGVARCAVPVCCLPDREARRRARRRPRVRTSRSPSERTVAVDDQQVYRTTVLANAKAPVPAAPSRVFEALKSSLRGARSPAGTNDPVDGSVRQHRFLEDRDGSRTSAMSAFLNCGESFTGPVANNYRIYISLLSVVRPDGKGGSEVETAFSARRRTWKARAAIESRAGRTGKLEERIRKSVLLKVGAPG